MSFENGDFLIYQIESGYGLLRILDVRRDDENETIWHLTAFSDFFPEVELADLALKNDAKLTISIPHAALTNRAFFSTQVSKLINKPLIASDLTAYENWLQNENAEISDRSIRLMLGLR
jgi:hypothetical protein